MHFLLGLVTIYLALLMPAAIISRFGALERRHSSQSHLHRSLNSPMFCVATNSSPLESHTPRQSRSYSGSLHNQSCDRPILLNPNNPFAPPLAFAEPKQFVMTTLAPGRNTPTTIRSTSFVFDSLNTPTTTRSIDWAANLNENQSMQDSEFLSLSRKRRIEANSSPISPSLALVSHSCRKKTPYYRQRGRSSVRGKWQGESSSPDYHVDDDDRGSKKPKTEKLDRELEEHILKDQRPVRTTLDASLGNYVENQEMDLDEK